MSLISQVADAVSRISTFIKSQVSNPMDMLVYHEDRRRGSTTSMERNNDGNEIDEPTEDKKVKLYEGFIEPTNIEVLEVKFEELQ